MDYLKYVNELLEHNPVAKFLGFEFTEMQPHQSVAIMEAKQEHLNVNGQIHGGILYTFCDSVAGLTAKVNAQLSTTLDGTIHYFANCQGGRLRGECIRRSKTNRISVYDVSVYNEEGILLCISTLTMYHALPKK